MTLKITVLSSSSLRFSPSSGPKSSSRLVSTTPFFVYFPISGPQYCCAQEGSSSTTISIVLWFHTSKGVSLVPEVPNSEYDIVYFSSTTLALTLGWFTGTLHPGLSANHRLALEIGGCNGSLQICNSRWRWQVTTAILVLPGMQLDRGAGYEGHHTSK